MDIDESRRLDKEIEDQIEVQINRIRENPEADRQGMVLAAWVVVAVWVDSEGQTAMDTFYPPGQLEPTTRGLLDLAIEDDSPD